MERQLQTLPRRRSGTRCRSGRHHPQVREDIHQYLRERSQRSRLRGAGNSRMYPRQQQLIGEMCVLGITTGKSPVGVFRALVDMHRNEGLEFPERGRFQVWTSFSPYRPRNSRAGTTRSMRVCSTMWTSDPRTSTFPTARCPWTRWRLSAASTKPKSKSTTAST